MPKPDPVSMATSGAILWRVRWIHFDHFSPSFFRFEDDDLDELSPSRVTDALGQVVVLDHPLDVQIFDFRRKAITKEMLERLRVIFQETLEKWSCELIEFKGEADHLHLLFQTNPTVQLSKLVNVSST
jgi:hypothetical protein